MSSVEEQQRDCVRPEENARCEKAPQVAHIRHFYVWESDYLRHPCYSLIPAQDLTLATRRTLGDQSGRWTRGEP